MATTARLVCEPIELTWTPAEAVLALRGDDRPFALVGAWADGSARFGSEPVRVARGRAAPGGVVVGHPP
ncbi:MAG: hypothetical protein IRZ32_09050, partial [Solirubrobacteraceae bacterium]|nr:hypothetical protein [Solirubrobacteraceae bacterium]